MLTMKKIIVSLLLLSTISIFGQSFFTQKIKWNAINSGGMHAHMSSRVKFDPVTSKFKFDGGTWKNIKSILMSNQGEIVFATANYWNGAWPASTFDANNEISVKDYTKAFGKVVITSKGNLGVGEMKPSAKLHVNGNQIIDNGNLLLKLGPNGGAPNVLFGYNSTNSFGNYGIEYLSDNVKNIYGLNFWIPFGGNNNHKNYVMFLNKFGNVGIGTDLSWDTGNEYKLAVKGKIKAQEIRVEIANWGDYVFTKNYKLLSLKEIETYIAKEGHLPNVPSAKEIEKDAYSLGELTKIQQVKIEELTLYLLQQEQKLINQELRLKRLEALLK